MAVTIKLRHYPTGRLFTSAASFKTTTRPLGRRSTKSSRRPTSADSRAIIKPRRWVPAGGRKARHRERLAPLLARLGADRNFTLVHRRRAAAFAARCLPDAPAVVAPLPREKHSLVGGLFDCL